MGAYQPGRLVISPLLPAIGAALGFTATRAGVAAGMLVVFLLATTPVLVLAALLVFAVGLMAFPPVIQAYLMDSFPTESMGGDLGAMRGVYIGLGALGPTVVGATADTFDFTVAFSGLVGCLLVSSLLIFWVSAR